MTQTFKEMAIANVRERADDLYRRASEFSGEIMALVAREDALINEADFLTELAEKWEKLGSVTGSIDSEKKPDDRVTFGLPQNQVGNDFAPLTPAMLASLHSKTLLAAATPVKGEGDGTVTAAECGQL